MPEYPPLIAQLLRDEELLTKLQPESPDHAARDRIAAAEDEALTGTAPVASRAALALARGGLLYAADALDAAHVFFQADTSDLASYWHGMMHRREGDFENARYWFRRAGRLPFFDALHGATAAHSPLMARQSSWDPYVFTGECERAKYGEEDLVELKALQRAEWEVAFDYHVAPGAGHAGLVTLLLKSLRASGSLPRVKLAVSLLLPLVLLAATGCNTLVTQRDVYSPKKGEGYWTTRRYQSKDAADLSLQRTPPRTYTPKPVVPPTL